MNIDELQDLIDDVTNWYEIKYPEREFEFYDGIIDTRFWKINSISRFMGMRQLMYRLTSSQLALMECNYRASCGGDIPAYDSNGNIIGVKAGISPKIIRKDLKHKSIYEKPQSFLAYTDAETGIVRIDGNLSDIIKEKEIKIDNLVEILSKNRKYDMTELQESVFDHNVDIELREIVLKLIALKLLQSTKTYPEYGYKRAERFFNEFNKKLNLDIKNNFSEDIINDKEEKEKSYEKRL